MAYGFPATYQPMVYQPNTQQTQNNQLIWVQGEAGAKSYLLAPNTTLPLWDSEAQVIYLKSTDASGMPSMKIIDYTIRDTSPAPAPISSGADYVTHDELKALEDRILKEVRHESNGFTSNGRRVKKQSHGNPEQVRDSAESNE